MSAPVVPPPLAAPPWVPVRKKPKLTLLAPPPAPPRVVWADERERILWAGAHAAPAAAGFAADKFAALGPEERDQEILRIIFSQGILAIDAGRHLSLGALRLALEKADRRFLAHYRLPHIALAKFGLEVAGDLVALIDRAPAEAMECLLHVESREVGEKLATKHSSYVDEWYRRFPRSAAHILVPIALTGNAKDSARALRTIASLLAAGFKDPLLAAAGEFGDEAVRELEIQLAPPPLPAKPPALPGFLDLATLPHVALDGAADVRLTPEQVERLVQLCACLPLAAARTTLVRLQDALEPASLGDLCRALLERWTAAGAPSDEKWIVSAVAILGDETTVQSLAEAVSRWAEEGKHPSVAVGVAALAGAWSDTALMHLVRFAETSKSKGLKKKAAAAIEELRIERRMTEDELRDRTVTDLGLDSRGELTLSYGPRSFLVVFDESLKVALRSGDKPLRSLPKAAAGDEPQLVARAEAVWNALKKESKAIVEAQARRLESAMCRGRRWSTDAFERYHLRHPLMQHFARRVLWGVWDAADVLTHTFRVAEDGTLANDRDEPVVLPLPAGAPRVQIGIVHPLAVDRDTLTRWGDVFGDYGVVQPFPQLARETFALGPEESGGRKLARFAGAKVEGGRFYSLKHRGWEFVDYDLGKRLSAGRTVMLHTSPGLNFLATKPDDQTLGEVLIGGAASFAELTAIEASEVVRDIEMLRA